MSFQCSNCKKELTTQGYLDTHLRKDVCNLKCNHCDFVAKDRFTLYRHVQKHQRDIITVVTKTKNTAVKPKRANPVVKIPKKTNAPVVRAVEIPPKTNAPVVKAIEIPNAPVVRAVEIPKNPNAKLNEYVYLLREREFIRLGEETYKIGRTKAPDQRFTHYPKGSELLMMNYVNDCKKIERALKQQFKRFFKQRPDYGTEYFTGNIVLMMKIVSHVTQAHKQQFGLLPSIPSHKPIID